MAISNYIKLCSLNEPGNSHLFLTEVTNIGEVLISGGEVTSMSMVGGKSFYQIQADMDSIIRREIGGEEIAKAWDHSVIFTAEKGRIALNDLTNQLKSASICGMAAIVIDNNSQCWLIGWNSIVEYVRGLYLNSYNYNSLASTFEQPKAEYNLITKSEFIDLPFNDAANSYIIGKIEDGKTLIDFSSPLTTPTGFRLLTPSGKTLTT